MEGARRHLVSHAEGGKARRELAGRLAGERQGEDVARVGAALGHAPGDAAGQHAGLARPGPGQDAQRRRVGGHGPPLGIVQALVVLIDVHAFVP